MIAGLTRGLDLGTLDRGWGKQDGRTVSYLREADVLGAVLPSNSPGVHSLWIPAIALKVPLFLKPGSQEPWTPMRIAQALLAAGLPPGAVGYYPADHSCAAEILLRCDRSMLFGDESTLRPWRQDTRVQLHGPGWSKVLIGEDRIDGWEEHLELIVVGVGGGRGEHGVDDLLADPGDAGRQQARQGVEQEQGEGELGVGAVDQAEGARGGLRHVHGLLGPGARVLLLFLLVRLAHR